MSRCMEPIDRCQVELPNGSFCYDQPIAIDPSLGYVCRRHNPGRMIELQREIRQTLEERQEAFSEST